MLQSGKPMRSMFRQSGLCGAPAGLLPRSGRQHKAARSSRPPVAAAAPGGGVPLVDPAAGGPRRIVVPQKLNPSQLEDVRKAEAFGPRGLLLIGMSEVEGQAVQAWFRQMEPGFVVSCCPAALLAAAGSTLQQAVDGGRATGSGSSSLQVRAWEAQPADAPPVAFFSGMSGEEQVAIIEGWAEHTGLQAPAFASVTPAIMDKPLSKLLADIVRAQAQQPPPGYDPEVVAQVQAAAAAAKAAGQAASAGARASSSSSSSASGSSASGGGGSGAAGASPAAGTAGAVVAGAAAAGGEQVLRSKLQDYVMLNGEEEGEAPMSLDALKEQIQEKMRAKKAQQAAAERQARREQAQDETDRLRQALRSGKAAGKKQQKQAARKSAGGGGGKGFGSS